MRTSTLLGILSLSACSGVIDMGDDTPHPTAVDVQISDGAIPAAGIHVIFQAADDSVLEDTMTDTAGYANAEMPNGGNVSIIRTYPLPMDPQEPPTPAEVYTYLGVKGGDHIVLSRAPSEDVTPAAINVMVPDTAQGTVRVDTPCGSGEGQAPIVALTVRSCPATVPMYVADNDGSFFVQMPYSVNIDVSTQGFTGSLSSSLSAVNVQPNTSVRAERRLEAGGWVVFNSGTQQIETTPANIDVPQLEGVDQVVVASISDQANHTQMVATRTGFESGPAVVDATANLIASISSPDFSPTGVTWLEDSPGAPDAVYVTLAVTRGGDGMPNPNNKYVHSIIAPYNGTSMRMPMLPDIAIIYNTSPADTVDGRVGLVKITNGGYDALRGNAFATTDLADATPLNSQLTLSYTGNPPGL